MSKLQALREKKKALAVEIRKQADRMNADGYVAAAGDEEGWVKVNEEYNAVLKVIAREETAEAVEEENTPAEEAPAEESARKPGRFIGARDNRAAGRELNRHVDAERNRELALASWCAAQMGRDLTDEQENACRAIGFNPNRKELALSLFNTRDARRLQAHYRGVHPNRAVDHCNGFKATLSTGSGPSGGYLIAPETLRTSLEVNMLAFGGVRQVAETIRTATGEPMSWPTADDTTNTGVQLGENTSIGSSVDPSFAKVLWSAYKFSSKPVLVPFELLQDSVFDLAGLLGQMLGERLGRITNTKFTTGTGAATAKGIVVAAGAFSAASATLITFDDVMGLEHSVDPAYRMGGTYMAHDSIMLALRKMKDGQGQPIWQSNWQAGMPDRLNGYAIVLNQDMDSTISSGKKTLLFGQTSKYKIRTVGDVRMYRLEERYRDTDQDGFVAFTREDGNLLDAGTDPVKVLTH